MVRSKFPGKPSKIVNRKIVNSSKYTLQQENESTKAAENISYGLAVFNEVFGDNDQVLTPFHGFSPHEVDRAHDIAKKQWDKVLSEYNSSGMIHKPEDAISIRLDPPTSEALSQMEADLDVNRPINNPNIQAQCHNSDISAEYSKPLSQSKYFSPFKGNFKKQVANRLLQRAKRSSFDGLCVNRVRLSTQVDKNGTFNSNVLKKFVLPSHSVRSSRVIKPNKRFLDSEENSKDLPSQLLHREASSKSRHIELKKPRLILESSNEFLLSKSGDDKLYPSDIMFTPLDGSVSLTPTKSNSVADGKHLWKHVKLGDLNVFGAPTTQPSGSGCSKDTHQEEDAIFPHQPVLISKPLPSVPSKSKLILRESKLSINTPSEKLQEGIFSRKPKKGLAMKLTASPVECEICGAVRMYRLAKQAHKFGINSCEPCRKFVARMIIKARSSENSVSCEKGQGNCAMTSTNKNESITSKIHKCLACWLLMCIQRFVSMPEQTRDSLIRMLPANMQGMTVIVPTTSSFNKGPLGRKKKRSQTHGIRKSLSEQLPGSCQLPSGNKRKSKAAMSRMRRKAALVSLANNLRHGKQTTALAGPISQVSSKQTSIGNKAEKVKKIRCIKKARPLPKASDKRGQKSELRALEKGKDGSLRQKLTPKGPRVKHVCRSASIVLGQPLATFPQKGALLSNNPCASNVQSDIAPLLDSNSTGDPSGQKSEFSEALIKCKPHDTASTSLEADNLKELCPDRFASLLPTSQQEKKISTKAPLVSNISQITAGRRTSVVNSSCQSGSAPGVLRGHRRTLQALSVYNTQVDYVPELLSLDFWESYDPDEVCNTGFGLIGFQPFNFIPVCFLCGSAGKEKLIHCASCCEPYHQFCVEMGVFGNPLPLLNSNCSEREEWRIDWVCPRCTVCHGCGRSSGHQLTSCQRCHNWYHLECLGSSSLRKNTGDRLWICSSCLRCKSCNSTVVTKFVGNLPFCKVCFKLRQKGNFCPLCQGCYTDDDYQSQMMECAECKAWVHAKCEGLSDEKYQVLSYLPESVEYVCRLCCGSPPATWWNAVEAELQAGYINILKAITKNRKACALLKWSPRKACSCLHNPVTAIPKVCNSNVSLGKRRLSFNHKENDVQIRIPTSTSSKTVLQATSTVISRGVKSSSSVFEFDDDIDAGENAPITKYINAREKTKTESIPSDYAVLQLECGNDVNHPGKGCQYSPTAGSQSDSGIGSTDDELKACSAAEEEDILEKRRTFTGTECMCLSQIVRPSAPTLLSVKKKVHASEYASLIEFHQDMDQLINEADSHEVKELYHQTLLEVFPWFDPKYTRVSRSSLPASPCKPYHGSLLQYQQSCSPEKNNTNPSSLKLLKSLIPSDISLSDDGYFYCGMDFNDNRICCFCKSSGDKAPYDEGRLLYCGQNDWVHVNCALWSAEVFEEIDGALQNVSNALSRGRMIRCSECGKKGASVGCCAKKCEETLHFPCARKAGFIFMEDKNVYCPLHQKDAPGKPLKKLSEFDISRPVFVELDRRKKKSIESKHVRVLIGSLFVESLGTIVPEMSDHGSVIIPTQFDCTRLYWSSKEPWRIVQYKIRTTVLLPVPEPALDCGHHVTVDHSKETDQTADQKTNEIDPVEMHASEDVKISSVKTVSSIESEKVKVVEEVMNQLLDTVCTKEADEEGTDAQNSADLLPPELKDAIFEDLPHDFLDGISMQDIFQDKFLNFEEQSKEDVQEERGESGSNSGSLKELAIKDKAKAVKSLKVVRELKRSKSDVLPCNSSQTPDHLHQRSCSLAWSCKLGSSISCCKTPRVRSSEGDHTQFIQELRLSVKPASSVGLKYCLQDKGDKGKENHTMSWPRIMQVDGICDTSCSDSSDVEEILVNDAGKKLLDLKSLSSVAETSKFFQDRVDSLTGVTSTAFSERSESISACPVHNKDFLQHSGCKRSVSRKRLTKTPGKKLQFDQLHMHIPQLDGSADASSDSDHDAACEVPSASVSDEKPVRCDRCRCTYRTSESYDRHLPSCSGDYTLTTSESEADVSEDEAGISEDEVSSSVKLVSGSDLNLSPSPDSAISVSSGSLLNVPGSSVAPRALPVTSSVTCTPSLNCATSKTLCETAPLVSTRDSPPVMVEQASTSSGVGNILTSLATVSNVMTASKSKVSQNRQRSTTVELLVSGNQPVMQEQNNQGSVHQSMHSPQQQSPVIVLDYHQSQQSAPTVLVQSVPSPAMVPTFLEAYQQHSGHNLQYVTTLDTGGGFGKTQLIAAVPSSVVPGAYQLQAVPESQLCVDPCTVGLPTLPGIQLTQTQLPPPHTQVLGTLIQSPMPCGVVTTAEPVYETIQMYPDQNGGVLLTSQPMLTCMETVVSNTYMSMSSSQFVSSSVPGMLEGSSTFSTTTTQVYQTGDVDSPVLDVPTQYVVVNPQANICDQRGSKIEVVSVQRRNIHEQTAIQTQSPVQMPSINLPMPAALPAPIPPQTLPPVIPTSVVPPMPRIQPQRTYSKPVKVNKEVQANGTTTLISSTSKPSIISSSKDKLILPTNKSSVGVLDAVPAQHGVKVIKKEHASIPKKSTQESGGKCREPSNSNESLIVLPSEFIATNIAPAQSITLPDPLPKLIVDERGIPDDSASGITGTPVRCPPVTFSYRPTVVSKSKQKTSSLQLVSDTASSSSLSESCFTTVKCPNSSTETCSLKSSLLLTTNPEDVQLRPFSIPSSQACQLSPNPQLDTSCPSELRTTGVNTSRISSNACFSKSVSKPIATIIPQTQVLKNTSTSQSTKQSSELISVSSSVSSSKTYGDSVSSQSRTSAVKTYSTLANQSHSLRPTVSSSNICCQSLSCSSAGAVCSHTNPLAPVVSKKSPIVAASSVSSEAMSSSFSASQTLVPASGTTATFSSLKPIVSTAPSLKPLQEIKTPNAKNVGGNSSPSRNQDKLLISVPPTVLKSSCHNYDLSFQNDAFNKPGDVPIIFASTEKSPTSLKLLFQKQAHNGCYKVSPSSVNKEDELTLMKFTDNIMSLNQKKGAKDESENVKPVIKPSKKSNSNTALPQLMIEIHGQDGFYYTSTSMSDVWQKVFDNVQEARAKNKMPPLLHNPFSSPESTPNLMGFGNNSVKYLIEQQRRVEDCKKYRPIYHKSRLPGPGYGHEELNSHFKESSTGCARTDPCMSLKRYDMFSWLDSRHRCPPKLLESNDFDSVSGGRRSASTNLPMAMRFRHLRETSKTSVGVFRSDIHGRGLFCLRDIEAGEMVIEYAGEVIRNTLTDNRERYYQSKGIDCYMFKVDDNFTVDATQKGNAARFINHSCEPNCYSRVVDIHGKKHIIIFAYRRIPQGEELTYDYKFPIEDVKIACHCLAPRCRKYLN